MAVEQKESTGVGQSIKRKEDDRFLQGRGNYVDDVKLPGMLHMAILRSPFAHARIRSIDTSQAKGAPGVVAVVTGAELVAHNLAWMPTLSGDTQAVLVTADSVRDFLKANGVNATNGSSDAKASVVRVICVRK